jgi:hypothetical protein
MAPGALIRHIEPDGLKVVEIPPWFDPAETLLFAAACIKSMLLPSELPRTAVPSATAAMRK